MPRRLTPELMDRPDAPRADLERALRYLRFVNRWLGGTRGLLRPLADWTREWPRDRPLHLIDIGAGSADIPIAACRWALARGLDLRVTAVDLHPVTLDLAREHVTRAGLADRITLLQADATRLMDHFEAGAFDIAHAGLFIHHLPELPALTVLRIMDRLTRVGLVWSDLHRSSTQLALVPLALWFGGPMVRHDGRVSVEAGFTRAEALDMARRVGLAGVRYTRWPGWYRFTLSARKPCPLTPAPCETPRPHPRSG